MRVASGLINKEVFSWAMLRANRTQAEMLKAFPQLSLWMTDEKEPTLKQLQDFSHRLSFPFGYFFLKSIPQDEEVIPLFRKASNEEKCLEVIDVINTIRDRQAWLSEYLKSEDADKVAIVGMCKDDTDVNTIISKMQSALHIESGFSLGKKNINSALSFIKGLLERAGIVIASSGVAGNGTNRPIPVSQCRGFCLVDDYAPFIFVNSRDAQSAQLFTLVHEATHVFTAFNAGYGYEDAVYDGIQNSREKLCDKVAANMLVPASMIKDMWMRGTKDTNALAIKFHVSQAVIVRRLLDEKLINKNEFYETWKAYKAMPNAIRKSSKGGNYYASQKTRIGEKLLVCLDTAIKQDKISPLDAYSLTGMKGDAFHSLMNKIMSKEYR